MGLKRLQQNGRPDSCDFADGILQDDFMDHEELPRRTNGVPTVRSDLMRTGFGLDQIAVTEADAGNGILDVCETDCNMNGIADDVEVATGTAPDFNNNGIDECDTVAWNLYPDWFEIHSVTSTVTAMASRTTARSLRTHHWT